MSLISFYTHWKHQKTSGLLMFLGYRKRAVAWNGLIQKTWTETLPLPGPGTLLRALKWMYRCKVASKRSCKVETVLRQYHNVKVIPKTLFAICFLNKGRYILRPSASFTVPLLRKTNRKFKSIVMKSISDSYLKWSKKNRERKKCPIKKCDSQRKLWIKRLFLLTIFLWN